jgi:16S rRNA (guanine1207-N2)-methyltransferase
VTAGSGGEQYFAASPRSGSRRSTVDLVLPDLHATLVVDRGVFSPGRIDAGTKYLLLEAPPPPAGAANLLDLGCGYGPIAVSIATRAPGATVWAVDVNDRALALCRENAAGAGLTNVRACAPDEVPAEIELDAIYSNPPIHVGKDILHATLTRWLARVRVGGHAYLVVHKHLGSDSLARWLANAGWKVSRLGSRGGYRLLDVEL